MTKLTSKQEKFVELIVAGKSQRQAYIQAYKPKKGTKEAALDTRAWKVMQNEKLRQRLEVLQGKIQKKAEEKAIMTALERQQYLTDIIRNDVKEDVYFTNSKGKEELIGSKTADLATKLKAMDMLNKMDKSYSTIVESKVEIVDKLEDLI